MPSLALLKRYSCCGPIDAVYSTHGSSDSMNQHPWLIPLLLSYSTLPLCCWMALIMFLISFFLQLLQPMVISSAPTCCGRYILNPFVWFLIPCCSIFLSSCFMLFFHLFTTPPDCKVLGARDQVFLNHPLTQACWPQSVTDFCRRLPALPPCTSPSSRFAPAHDKLSFSAAACCCPSMPAANQLEVSCL